MNFQLIGFAGLAGSGKSTAAKALVDQRGFVRVSFASPLRAMLGALGLTLEQMSTGKNDPIDWLDGKTPRQLLQTLGTEWGRTLVHRDIWIRAASRHVAQLRNAGASGVVFDDVRFDNEAEMIQRAGGLVIRIHRDGLTAMGHASEAGVSDKFYDAVIFNEYAEDVFSAIVVKMVERFVDLKVA
jgi:hypothetical protein